MTDNLLNTPDRVARFLILLDYPREKVANTIRGIFPGVDPEPHIEAAIALADEATADLERALDREAIEQEHKPTNP